MAGHIYRLGGIFICFGLIVLLAFAMLLAAGFEEIGGQVTYNTLWIPRIILFAMGSICFGLLTPDAQAGTKSAISYLVGAIVLSYGVSVADRLVNGSTQVLAGVGLVLIAPSFPSVIRREAGILTAGGFAALLGLLGWDTVRDGFSPTADQQSSLPGLALALLAVVLGLTHRRTRGAMRWSVPLSWLYLTGLVLLILWDGRDSTLDPRGIGYTVWLSLLLIPLGVTLFGVLRHKGWAEVPERIYVIGGLSVCFGFILWGGTAPILGFGGDGLESVIVGTFWYPLALILAMGSVCFGFLSPDTRPGRTSAMSYAGGAMILALGAEFTMLTAGHVAVWPSRLLTGIGLALIVPSFLVVIVRSTSGKATAYTIIGAAFLALAAQVRC